MIQWIVSSSLLLFVLIGLRYLLRGRIKPKLQYALWALALVRLLLPISFGSAPISVENAVDQAPLVQEIQQAERVESFTYQDDGYAVGYYSPLPDWEQTPGDITEQEPVTEVFTHAEANRITHLRNAKEYLTYLWIGGMVVMGAVFLVSNLVFALRLRRSRKLLEKDRLPVYVTEATETPCLFGIFRPAIYLTPAVAEEEHHRIYAIAHETTHFRHGDALWTVLRSLCLVVHWYNPLVWWAAVLSRADGEIACDESTIAALGESQRADYGRVLIDLTCRKKTDLLRTATTMTGSAKGLKERIKSIAKKPKMALFTLIAVILVAGIVVGCTFTGAKEDKESTDPTTPTTAPTTSTQPTGTTAPEKEDFLQQVDGIPLAQEELDSFTKLFAYVNAEKEADINWYNIMLSCGWTIEGYKEGFAVPEDINLKILFNNGFGESSKLSQWTAEELAFIQGIYPGYPENWGDLYRLPKEKMERVLQDYLGITLQQSNKVWMDKLEFYPYTDCYFIAPAGAMGEMEGKIAAGKRCADGMVYLIYHRDNPHSEGFLLLRLMPNPGNKKVPYRVKTCIQIKSAKDILPFLRPALHLPTAEQMTTQNDDNSKYFLLKYLPTGEIMDGGYTGKPYTTAGMEMDFVYAIDDGVTYPISGGQVSDWAKDLANGYVYFVKEEDPRKIWRTDLHGQNPTVAYESQYGDITFLSCVNGWLSIIENDNRAALFDTNTGKLTVLLNAYRIGQFSYDAEEMRVFWKGKLTKKDAMVSWYSEDDSYYYDLETNQYQVLMMGTDIWVTVTPET